MNPEIAKRVVADMETIPRWLRQRYVSLFITSRAKMLNQMVKKWFARRNLAALII